MAGTGLLQTFGSTGGAKEDILDLITNITPTETPFLSRCGVSKANGVYHIWLTDVMNATASSGDALVEGESATNYALTDKTRLANYTQISDRVFTISGTEEAVSHYGLDSQYAYQLEKAMKELKIKMERILLGNTATTAGAAAVARYLKGAFAFASAASQSGAVSTSALTETNYNALCQSIYENGGNPDTTFVNGFLKRRISAFSSNNLRTKEMADKKLTGVVSVYESDFGTQEIVLDRHCKGLANTDTGAGLVCEIDKFRVAYLRKPFTQPLAIDGDRKSVQILCEYTLEQLNDYTCGRLSAFATAAV
jgi:hypothetical protein